MKEFLDVFSVLYMHSLRFCDYLIVSDFVGPTHDMAHLSYTDNVVVYDCMLFCKGETEQVLS